MLEAGRIRLRPILMTSVATIFGAMPIAFGLGAGSGSRRPLGYSIIGGLLLSTMLTLFLVPAVFVVFERLRRHPVPVSAKRPTTETSPIPTAVASSEAR
jgi:multidrug efflux pump subunit AcrB